MSVFLKPEIGENFKIPWDTFLGLLDTDGKTLSGTASLKLKTLSTDFLLK